jgi:hypothetical protein
MVLGFAACMVAAPASAGTLGKGASEIQGSAGLQTVSVSGSSVTQISLDAFYGWCIDEHWEFGPEVSVASLSGGGSTQSDFGANGLAVYNFALNGNTLVPFVGAGLGFSSFSPGGGGSSITTTVIPIVEGGVRCLMGSSASINFLARYQHESMKEGGVTISPNEFGIQVGLSVFPNGFGTGGGGAMKQ